MPEPLLWLIFPLLATLVAIVWTAWSGRTRGPEQTDDSIEAHERFRRAMAAQVAGQAPPRVVAPRGVADHERA